LARLAAEQDNPDWTDLAVALGFAPLPQRS
jgi:hypothetical protein